MFSPASEGARSADTALEMARNCRFSGSVIMEAMLRADSKKSTSRSLTVPPRCCANSNCLLVNSPGVCAAPMASNKSIVVSALSRIERIARACKSSNSAAIFTLLHSTVSAASSIAACNKP
jgi:hypothetical protein